MNNNTDRDKYWYISMTTCTMQTISVIAPNRKAAKEIAIKKIKSGQGINHVPEIIVTAEPSKYQPK